MTLLRSLIAVCLLGLVTTFGAGAQGTFLTNQLRSELAAQREELTAGFSPLAARGQVQRAFEAASISYSTRFIGSWSDALSARWALYEQFFTAHQERLDGWILAVEDGVISADQADAVLRPGLARAAMVATQFQDWLNADLAYIADRARWTDLAHEVGCCDMLYYQALTEAETAAAAHGGPSPEALANLVLVPEFAAEPADLVFPTRDSLLMDLSERASAFLQSGRNNAAERAALLHEAVLILEIFPRGPVDEGTLSLLRADLQREDASLMPPAPLLSLARITEPGPTRSFLLNEARDRLQAMWIVAESEAGGAAQPVYSADITSQSSNDVPEVAADPVPMVEDEDDAETVTFFAITQEGNGLSAAPSAPAGGSTLIIGSTTADALSPAPQAMAPMTEAEPEELLPVQPAQREAETASDAIDAALEALAGDRPDYGEASAEASRAQEMLDPGEGLNVISNFAF